MQPLRILYLEDNQHDVDLVRAALTEAHVECAITRVDSREAYVQELDSCHFDLILSDFDVPGFDGRAALNLAAERCDATTPFLFVSGTLGEETAAEVIRLGAVDYVLKSNLSRLPLAVQRALREADEYRQRQRVEEALRESVARFRQLTEALPQVVWSARPDGSIDYGNRRWLEYTGESAAESADRIWKSFVHADDLPRVLEHWQRAVETGEELRIEHRFRRHDGAYRWFLTQALPLRNAEGDIRQWIGSSTDIHDEKIAQEQLQQINDLLERRVDERTRTLREHQEQLRAMASDLTLTEQRERRRLASELHDYLAQLLVASKMKTRLLMQLDRSSRAQGIVDEINDLLEQSIKYTRTLIAELSPTILYDAGLGSAVRWLADQMQRHGLRVTVIDEDGSVYMPDDQAVLVFQTIRELLINVAKHAMVHEAMVTLERRDEKLLTVTVADRGVGFEPQTAEGPLAVGKYGLFSIRERLEALGGTFEIDSHPGEGTRASFTVAVPPLEEPETAVAEYESPVEPVEVSPARSMRRRITRVLLADDHHMVREGLRSLIESEPRLRVVGEAANGEEAIRQARVLHPDVVVMDINMPKLNGIEATRRLREELPSIAVIALSMHEDQSMINAIREAGAVSYIAKGGVSEELSRAIREAHGLVLSGNHGALPSGNP